MNGAMRLTQQEVDPIGGVAASPLVVVGAVLTVGAAIGVTAVQWADVTAPAFAVIAILLVTAAGIVASVSSLPERAPFTADRLWVTVSLATAAAIAEYVSMIGAGGSGDPHGAEVIHYGPLVVGVMILACAPFCTWPSLLVAGGIAAIVLAILDVGSAGGMTFGTTDDATHGATDGVTHDATHAPTGAALAPVAAASHVILDAVTVLAFAAAAAAYSATIVRETLGWQRQANTTALERDAGLRTGIARSVQQGRVSVLGREVLPFLARVMTVDDVTVADADRARALAEALRRALRAGVESTWLDDLAESLASVRPVVVTVDDPGGAANRLGAEQRPAITALLSWLSTGARARDIRLSVSATDGTGRIVVEADGATTSPMRRELERFQAAARTVGLRSEVAVTRENVRVEYRYDAG